MAAPKGESQSRWAALVAALVVAFHGVSLAAATPQNWLEPEGPVAQTQKDVFMVTFWVDMLILVIVGGMLLYAVTRFRGKSGDDEPPVQVEGNIRLEVSLMVVSALLLVIIEVPNIKAIFYSAAPPADVEVIDIDVTGHRWWWEFSYPAEGLTVANEITIPVGVAVNFHLETVDVIHSFWVPKLGGKMDLIPGRTNQVWLQADRAGTYYGQCAELCGASHANMRLRVHALDRPEYEAWMAAQKGEMAPLAAEGARGAKLFVQRGCNACHTVRGLAGAVGIIGPDLTHLASRTTIASALLENTSGNLTKWLTDPESIKPENQMSTQGPMYNGTTPALTAAEIGYLVAFLQGLE